MIVAVVALAYLVVVAVAARTVATAREAVLVRGGNVLRVNAAFVGALLVAAALDAGPSFAIVFAGVVAAVALAMRGRWLIFRSDAETTRSLIEDSFSRVHVQYARDGERFVVVGGTRPVLRVSSVWLGIQSLKFDRGWRENRPALARSLLAKRFRGPLPELRVRIGGGAA